MGSSERIRNTDTGEMFLAIAAREARTARASQQRYARILDQRGFDHARIIEMLDIDEETLKRMLAVDGHPMDPDCAQGKHRACIGQALDVTSDDIVPCGCECHDHTEMSG